VIVFSNISFSLLPESAFSYSTNQYFSYKFSSVAMSRKTQTVYSEGIFSGLPTFPAHDGKKYTAIVTGANGISGSVIVDVLATTPERWETIYAMSRRPPTTTNPRVKPIAADFLSSTPEELAALFKKEGIKAWVLSMRSVETSS